MNFIKNRLKERSTWVGILTLASICGVNIRPDIKESIITLGLTIGSIVLALTADPKTVVEVPKDGNTEAGTEDNRGA